MRIENGRLIYTESEADSKMMEQVFLDVMLIGKGMVKFYADGTIERIPPEQGKPND